MAMTAPSICFSVREDLSKISALTQDFLDSSHRMIEGMKELIEIFKEGSSEDNTEINVQPIHGSREVVPVSKLCMFKIMIRDMHDLREFFNEDLRNTSNDGVDGQLNSSSFHEVVFDPMHINLYIDDLCEVTHVMCKMVPMSNKEVIMIQKIIIKDYRQDVNKIWDPGGFNYDLEDKFNLKWDDCYVFTWHGATIEIDGATETDYTADETPMISYVNVHAILDGRRNRAKASTNDSELSQGPRVIIVGPTDSGKSILTRMLLSWAAKQGWKPTYVDLDVGQGSITAPGCIAATPVEMPIDLVEGIPLEMPLAYFYGKTTPSVNPELYKTLVKELAQVVEKQLAGNVESRAAGMVINTMGWIEGVGYELLLHAIDTLKANVVLVLGQEKLYSMFRDVLKSKPNVDVVKLQKSGGVVSRSAKVRHKTRSYKIKEYFYGLANDLSPHSNVASFNDLSIYRIGGGPQAPRSALPIGAEPTADPTRLAPVNISHDLLHQVLAISYAKEPNQIISSNIAGFIYMTDIDIQRKFITYLAPSAGELPGKYVIMGSLAWTES